MVLAANLRLKAEVREETGDFRLSLSPQEASLWAPGLDDLKTLWQAALEKLIVDNPVDLAGLHILFDFGEQWEEFPPHLLLSSPAAALALACAVRAHRGGRSTLLTALSTSKGPESIGAEKLASLAGALLSKFLVTENPLQRDRFYAECLVSILGGAHYVTPASEPLNVQLLVPPESLILVVSGREFVAAHGPTWGEALQAAIRKLGPGVPDLIAAADDDIAALFEKATGTLEDRETAVLYGILRVREMISEYLEKLGQPFLDYDLFAELCDEESAIMEDYFEFPAEIYRSVRERAMDNGALGGKFTYAFGVHPALIILAPGRRAEVIAALEKGFDGYLFLPVDVDGAGVSPA